DRIRRRRSEWGRSTTERRVAEPLHSAIRPAAVAAGAPPTVVAVLGALEARAHRFRLPSAGRRALAIGGRFARPVTARSTPTWQPRPRRPRACARRCLRPEPKADP